MKHSFISFYNKLPILLFVLIILGACKKNDPKNENEIVQEITTAVNAITIDNKNTKWVGTDDGLYRSIDDGFQIVDISESNKIHALFYDNSNDLLWIGTETALLNAIITKNGLNDVAISNENLSDPKVVSMHFDDDSKHWFGTETGFSLNYNDKWKNGIFRVNSSGKTFPMTVENFTVNSITSWDGDYFFATSGAKLYRAFDFDETVDAFTGATQWDFPYNGYAISDTMFVVFIDNVGNQWMGGKEGIQVHKGHDPKDFEAFTYYYDELPDFYVLTINQAPNNDIWVGTRKGLAKFDGSNWETIADGLPGLIVNSIAFDEDGSAWVGTNKGLAHIE